MVRVIQQTSRSFRMRGHAPRLSRAAPGLRGHCAQLDRLAEHVTSFAKMMTKRTGQKDLASWLDRVETDDQPRSLACNRHLGEAVQQWAFCSLRQSAWAREF